MVKFIKKRDGKIARFDSNRIRKAISKAANAVHIENPDGATDLIYSRAADELDRRFNDKTFPAISDIEEIILNTARRENYPTLANAYESYRDKRAEVRRLLEIAAMQGDRSTTDAALLIESDSKEVIGTWDRKKIVEQLEREAELSTELATDIAKHAENFVFDLYNRGVRKLNTTDVRAIVDLALRQEELEPQRRKQTLLGIPTSDLEAILINKSNDNSNISSNNPETLNLGVAETVLKQYALNKIFSPEVAKAHLEGRIYVHNLGYPARVYCSSHSLEYIKKFGLNKILANLESKSNPPNSALVLNQHVQTFLASMQAPYAGALGFGFLNIFYAPLLKRPVDVVKGRINGQEFNFEKKDLEKLIEQGEISRDKNNGKYFEIISEKKELREISSKEMDQVAQNLIYAASQNAFSRGGQTLFIDFNVHTGVPNYLRNVPAIGSGGKYMIQNADGSVEMADEAPRFMNLDDKNDSRNGDADNTKLENGRKIVTYGDLESTVQKFAMSLLKIWRKGDKFGRPFHFPKCDLHVNENSFTGLEEKVLDYAVDVTAENGSVYFLFDRGDEAVLAQCCRLKQKIEDPAMLKYPEKLRFCGFQNVTVNLAQAAYRGKDLENTIKEIDKAMELAVEAHQQKAEFIQHLLDSNGSPIRHLGVNSDDGMPYVDLKKATYIIGNIGLNEAVQAITGKQLHESEDAYKLGLGLIAHMYKKTEEFSRKNGLKFAIEETPAEGATRRLAKVDKQQFEKAREVVKGTKENPYYTNSIHFAADADIGLVDRINGQSKFHEMIKAGAIIHAYIGEQRPDAKAIKKIVKQTHDNTQCSQLTFSPTYTECDECGAIMNGDVKLCITPGCKNHSPETARYMETLVPVTRIVGYYARLNHWNASQQQMFEDRKKAEEHYSGKPGRDMNWLYNPDKHERLTLIQFGKRGCKTCENVENIVNGRIKKLELEGKVDYRIHYLDENPEEGLTEAAMYNIPLDTVPSLVVAGKNSYWKKTTRYSKNNERSDLIRPREVEQAITDKLGEYT